MNNEINAKSATLEFIENVPKESWESILEVTVLAIIQPREEDRRKMLWPMSPKLSTMVETKPLEIESLER